jgi:hypothetical protein
VLTCWLRRDLWETLHPGGPQLLVPAGEDSYADVYTIADGDETRTRDWDDRYHPAPGTYVWKEVKEVTRLTPSENLSILSKVDFASFEVARPPMVAVISITTPPLVCQTHQTESGSESETESWPVADEFGEPKATGWALEHQKYSQYSRLCRAIVSRI